MKRRKLPVHQVVVLVPPGGQLIGVFGFIEAFDAANQVLVSMGRSAHYAMQVVGVGPEVRSASGVVVRTGAAAEVTSVDTLVVGGSLAHAERAFPSAVAEAARRLHSLAGRTIGICAGAFLLAELGLLEGRRCTTHWLGVDALQRRCPTARVEPDALFVHDGVTTSAGATAGIDLALDVIRTDLGDRLALAVARTLVVFAQRPGGQSQFATSVRLRGGVERRLQELLDGIVSTPGGDHRVDVLAARIGMSPRNFARLFRKQTHTTPAAFVARARVDAAQQALVHTTTGLEQIAADCGFPNVDTFRRTFRRVSGVNPVDYRKRFTVPPGQVDIAFAAPDGPSAGPVSSN